MSDKPTTQDVGEYKSIDETLREYLTPERINLLTLLTSPSVEERKAGKATISIKHLMMLRIIAFEYAKRELISAERLAEMRQAVLRYGPANCWTGTTGMLAAMVFELLKAIGEERGT